MHHTINKQQKLFVFIAVATAFSVEGSQNSNPASSTRRQLNGAPFARDMQQTAFAAQKQKNDDEDHPIRQNPEALARFGNNRFGSAASRNPYRLEESSFNVVAEYKRPAKEDKKQKPLKNNKSKVLSWDERTEELNKVFAEVNEYQLEEEIVLTPSTLSQAKPAQQSKMMSRSELTARLATLVIQPTPTPVIVQEVSMEVEEQVVNHVEEETGFHKVSVLSLFDNQSMLLRNNPESREIQQERAELINKNSHLSGGTWDYRNERTFKNKPRK